MTLLDLEIGVRRSDAFAVDVALSLSKGEVHCLLGPNGAGKSTVVETLAGMIALDHGRITVNGVPWDDPSDGVFVEPQVRSVGVVFQDVMLFPHMTVRENVAFGPVSRAMDGDAIAKLVESLASRYDFEGVLESKPPELSGGQAQRVAVARALATGPDVLLLDEPFAALDAEARPRLRSVLADGLDGFDGATIVITHDPTEAFLLGDVIHIMEAGSIVQSGTPAELRLAPATPYVARVAGVNLVGGEAAGGKVAVGDESLTIADSSVVGPVLVSFQPQAVALHATEPEGSARNRWSATVQSVEPLGSGSTARVHTVGAIEATAEVTVASISDLALRPGSQIWVSIKATELSVHPSAG